MLRIYIPYIYNDENLYACSEIFEITLSLTEIEPASPFAMLAYSNRNVLRALLL